MLHLRLLLVLVGLATPSAAQTLEPRLPVLDPSVSGTWSAEIGDRKVLLELSATRTELLAATISFPTSHEYGLSLFRCVRRGDSLFAESTTEGIRMEAVFLRADSTLDVLLIRDRIPSAAIFKRASGVSVGISGTSRRGAVGTPPPAPTTRILEYPDRTKGIMQRVAVVSPAAAPSMATGKKPPAVVVFDDGKIPILQPLLDSLVASGCTVIWSDTLTRRFALAALSSTPHSGVITLGTGLGMDEAARMNECDSSICRVYLWMGHDPNAPGGRIQAQTYAARTCTGSRSTTTAFFEFSQWDMALDWVKRCALNGER